MSQPKSLSLVTALSVAALALGQPEALALLSRAAYCHPGGVPLALAAIPAAGPQPRVALEQLAIAEVDPRVTTFAIPEPVQTAVRAALSPGHQEAGIQPPRPRRRARYPGAAQQSPQTDDQPADTKTDTKGLGDR